MSFRRALCALLLLGACDEELTSVAVDSELDARAPAPMELLDASEQLVRGEDARTAQDAHIAEVATDARVEDARSPEPDAGSLDCGTLTYDNFGAQFMYLWCDFCHAKQVPTFNTLADIRVWAPAMSNAALVTRSMPPGGNANYLRDPQREAFARWLDCGAP